MQLDLEAFVEFLWSTEKLSALGAFWVESKLLTKQNNKKKKYGIRNYIVKEEKKKRKNTGMQPLLNFDMPLYKLTKARFKHLLLPLMHDQDHF